MISFLRGGERKERKLKTAHVEPVSCLFWSTLERPRSQCITAWCTCTSVSSSNCMIISHWSPRRARFMVNYYSCWSFPPLISPFIFYFQLSATYIYPCTNNNIRDEDKREFEFRIDFFYFPLWNSLNGMKLSLLNNYDIRSKK